jgi:hypothetical protein
MASSKGGGADISFVSFSLCSESPWSESAVTWDIIAESVLGAEEGWRVSQQILFEGNGNLGRTTEFVVQVSDVQLNRFYYSLLRIMRKRRTTGCVVKLDVV